MKDFNIIKWAARQPKDVLMGIFIFAATYLVFLNFHNLNISPGEHIIWLLLFLTGSLLIGFFISFLFKGLIKKIHDFKKSYVTHMGAKILRLFPKTSHHAIREQIMVEHLKANRHSLEYHIEKLIASGHLETDDDGFGPFGANYWLTHKGRKFLVRRFLL